MRWRPFAGRFWPVGRNAGWLLLGLALGLLILPIWWVAAAVLAAGWHELCHYIALRLCGRPALGIRAGLIGVVMEVRFDGPGRELLCAMAGPLGSLLLLLFTKWMPRTAICAGFQGLYNLLPIYPLDGGRILRCLTELVLPVDAGRWLCRILEMICLVGVALMSLYGCFRLHLGPSALLMGGVVIWRAKYTLQTKEKFGTMGT